MEESTECLMSSDVISDAIELKETRERNAVRWEADRRKLWDVMNQQRDYQDFIREVLTNAGIKDPNQSASESETESERAIGIAHEDHLNDQNVEPNYVRNTSPVYGENEVCGSHKGRNKNVILTDDADASDYEAPLSLHMEHGNSYGLLDEPKSSRRVLLSENGNTSDDVGGSLRPRKLIWSSSRDVPREDSVRIGQEKCSRKRNVVKGHDEEKRRIMIQNRTGDLNLRRSSRLDATSGDQNRNLGLENAVQNAGKLGKPVKGKRVDLEKSEPIRRLSTRFQESQSDTDSEAPAQSVWRLRKAVKGKSALQEESESTRKNVDQEKSEPLRRMNKSQGESDDEVLERNVRRLRKAVKAKSVHQEESASIRKRVDREKSGPIRRTSKRFPESQSESDSEAPTHNVQSPRKAAKRKSVRQEESKYNRNSNMLSRESQSESEDEVQFLGEFVKASKGERAARDESESMRKSNKQLVESQSESDGEAAEQSVGKLRKDVNGKSVARRQIGFNRKSNKQVIESQSGEDPVQNVGKLRRTVKGKSVVPEEVMSIRETNMQFQGSENELYGEAAERSVRKLRKAVKGKSVVPQKSKFTRRSIECQAESDGEAAAHFLGNFRRAVKQKSVIPEEAKSITKSNMWFQESQIERKGEAQVQNVEKLRKAVKGKSVVPQKGEFIRSIESQTDSDGEAPAKILGNFRRMVKQKSVVPEEGISIMKSNRRFQENQSESEGEAQVQNVEKLRQPVNEKSVVPEKGESLRKSNMWSKESQSESDGEAPIQNVENLGKAVKRNSVAHNGSEPFWKWNMQFTESQHEGDNEATVQNVRRLRKEVNGKSVVPGENESVFKNNKVFQESHNGNNGEASAVNVRRLRKAVRGEDVVREESEPIRKKSYEGLQLSQSESTDALVQIRKAVNSESTRKYNNCFQEAQSESDSEPTILNLRKLRKPVGGNHVVREESVSIWKTNKLLEEGCIATDGEAGEVNQEKFPRLKRLKKIGDAAGKRPVGSPGSQHVHQKHLANKKGHFEPVEFDQLQEEVGSRSKTKEVVEKEYTIQKGGSRFLNKLNNKSIRNIQENDRGGDHDSTDVETQVSTVGLIEENHCPTPPSKIDKSGTGCPSEISGADCRQRVLKVHKEPYLETWQGLARADEQQQQQNNIFTGDVSSIHPYELPVATRVKQNSSDSLLEHFPNGDGGLQGLDWYLMHLRVDEDGDIGDEFLVEVLPDVSIGVGDENRPVPKFRVNHQTEPASVKDLVLLPTGKIHTDKTPV